MASVLTLLCHQAMAKDSLYPFVHPFAFGTQHGDEPRYAVVSASHVMTGLL